jgi:hypothetical protein
MTQRSQIGGGVRWVSRKVQNRCHVSGHVLRTILLIGPTKICRIHTMTRLKPDIFYVKLLRDYLLAYKNHRNVDRIVPKEQKVLQEICLWIQNFICNFWDINLCYFLKCLTKISNLNIINSVHHFV